MTWTSADLSCMVCGLQRVPLEMVGLSPLISTEVFHGWRISLYQTPLLFRAIIKAFSSISSPEPLHGSASNEDGVFYYLSPKDRPIQGSNGSRVHHWVNFDVQNLRSLSLISKDTLDQAGPDDEGWEDVWAFQRDAEFSRPKGSRRGMPTWRSEARLPSRDLSQARSSGDGCSESLEIRQEVPPSGSIDSPWTGRRPGEAKQGQRLSRDRGPSHSGAQIYRGN